MRNPGDVLLGIQPHIRDHAGEEDVVGGSNLGYGDRLPLQVADGADALRPEKLPAADMNSRQDDDQVPRVHLKKKRPAELQGEVDLTGGESRLLGGTALFLDVVHLGEPLPL